MNPKRQPGPILRTVIPTRPAPTVGTNPALRVHTVIEPAVVVRRSRAVPMTGAQRDTNGNRSDWNKPCHLRPGTTPMMPAWSSTVSNRPSPAPVRANGPRWTP